MRSILNKINMDLNRDQLAYEWNSLPRYIYINAEGQPWNFEADLAAYNCCDYQFNSPWNFYVETNAAAQVPMDLAIEDVVAPFTLLNQAYINLVHSLGDNFFYLQATFKIDPSEFEVLAAIWNRQMEYADALLAEKASFRATYEAKLAEARQLAEVAAFKSSKHQILSTNHVYSFEKHATLLDIFNDLEVTKELPLVTTHTFYKVLVDFPYVLESPTDENTMFLFYNNTRVVLVYNGDYVTPKYEITMQTSESIEEMKRLLKIDRLTFIKEKLNITVNFFAPDRDTFDFNKYIWADIVMNNGPISSLFVIDEKQRTHRMGTTVSAIWLSSARQSVACMLRAVNDFDAKRKKQVTKIEAKLLNCEEDDIAAFKADLGAALGYYYVYATQIVAEYNAFLSVKIKLVKPDDRKPRLKDMEPELFVTGYKRSCQFVPEIIDEAEVKEYEERGYQVMLYPIAGDDTLALTNSGAQYYTCIRDPIHVYPGLRLNNLPNKDKFPYLPCCFKDDQTVKHNAAYKLYLEGHHKQARQVHDTRRGFIKTDKTLGARQLGEPPAKLKQLFSLPVTATNIVITREGTSKSPASVLECILKHEMADLDEKGRASRLDKERARLAKLSEAEFNVARQETWNIGLERARDILKDRAAYLDPRLFYSLLEYHYNCRLVLLDRNDFINPLYAYIFAHFYSSARIVIVYENFGGEAEYLTIPQCETFNGLESIAEQIYEQYISSFMLYHVDVRGRVSALIAPEEETKWDGKIIAQHLNAYGQAENLDIQLAGQDIVTYQLPFPIAPLPIIVATSVRSNVDARRIATLPIVYGATMYRIDNVVPSYKKTHSWMNDYLEMRRLSQHLVEQARYARSRGAPIYIGTPRVDDSRQQQKWPSIVRAPSENIRKKLDYAVTMFRKYNTAEFENYKDYTVIPNQYKTVSDFTTRAGQVVAFSNDTIKWSRIVPVLENEPSLVAADFYIELAGKVYHCFRVERPDTIVDAHVAVFNTQSVFVVGKPPATAPVSFLFYVTEGKIVHTYQCFTVSSQ